VLARVFLTVRFDALPVEVRTFVENLAKSASRAERLRGLAPVLSLVGTRGQEASWNARGDSRGHQGIPLISSSFVGAIPMISRLFRELGVPLHWIDSDDAQRIAAAVGRSAGLFFVPDAETAVDDHGRKIIAAQDFVATSGVKTVFGTGGAYAHGVVLRRCGEPGRPRRQHVVPNAALRQDSRSAEQRQDDKEGRGSIRRGQRGVAYMQERNGQESRSQEPVGRGEQTPPEQIDKSNSGRTEGHAQSPTQEKEWKGVLREEALEILPMPEQTVLLPEPKHQTVHREQHVPEEGWVVEGVRVQVSPGQGQSEGDIRVLIRLKGQRVISEADRREA
jgi:hypothetical protein